MTKITRCGALLGSASALVLGLGTAVAQDQPADANQDEAAAAPDTATPEEIVEVGPADPAMMAEGDFGDAVAALAGMPAGEIEGLDVFDEAGERIGTVRMVAQSESGGVYLIVRAEEDSPSMVVGDHAIPLPRFNYDEGADALVLWADPAAATTGMAGTAMPYGGAARVYTVLDAEQEIPQVAAEQYEMTRAEAAPEAEGEQEDLAELEDQPAVQPATEAIMDRDVDEIVGLDVINRNREDLGEVQELAADSEGQVYLIVSLNDGILGIGDSERAVKLEAFEYSLPDESLVLMDASQEQLEALPEYDDSEAGFRPIETDQDWATFK